MSVLVYTCGMRKKALGVYLRVLRDLQGITQAQVAAHLETTERQIRKWEKGTQDPAGTTLAQILDRIHGDTKDIARFIYSDGIAAEVVAEAVAKDRYKLLQIDPDVRTRIDEAESFIAELQSDLPRFDRWLGYGASLRDEANSFNPHPDTYQPPP